MTKQTYAGTWTALITPFKEDGSIDEKAWRNLIKIQIKNGVTGILPLGTTGESPTISQEEREILLKTAVEEAKNKIMVMAGTGSNCTKKTIENTEMAKKLGVDLCLVITPYYNKPTPKGQILHFQAVAEIGLPVMVYNIKGRTGVNIGTETLMKIAEHPMIVGVKEASGDLAQMKEVLASRPNDFSVLSGDDGMILDLIQAGGDGTISVASNVVPDKIAEMVDYALGDNFEEAEKINEKFLEMFDKLFVETNPIPVKYCLSKMGLCEMKYRLPMCEPEAQNQKVLDEMLYNYNLL